MSKGTHWLHSKHISEVSQFDLPTNTELWVVFPRWPSKDSTQSFIVTCQTHLNKYWRHCLNNVVSNRGALHRQNSDYNSAIDDYLLAMDKRDHDYHDVVYKEAQRQLLLSYNDFAVECFRYCARDFDIYLIFWFENYKIMIHIVIIIMRASIG